MTKQQVMSLLTLFLFTDEQVYEICFHQLRKQAGGFLGKQTRISGQKSESGSHANLRAEQKEQSSGIKKALSSNPASQPALCP